MLRTHSLKTRITILTLAVFFICIWLMTFTVSHLLYNSLERQLSDQQFSAAVIVAEELQHEFEFRKKSLERVAADIGSGLITTPESLQSHLENSQVFLSLFNGGCYVIRADGTAIADVPVTTGRVGMNVSEKGWFVEALQGKSAIGKPVIGKMLKVPVFTMATPVRDPNGEIVGVLAGVVDLSRANFLDKISATRYGRNGDYYLVAPQHRLIVTSSDRKRVMQPLPDKGVNPAIDRNIDGFEGSTVLVNPVGVEQLASMKRIPAAGWYLAVALPTEEAFAPIRTMQHTMMLCALIFSVLSGGITWWLLRWQLAPMLATVGRLSSLTGSDGQVNPLPIERNDEIGHLIGAFNTLLASLSQRQQELLERDERHRTILQAALSGIWLVDMEGRLLEVNDAYCRMSGYSKAELLTMHISDLDAFESEQDVAERNRLIIERGTAHFTTQHKRKDGSLVDVEVSVQYRTTGGGLFVGFIQDITERKQAQDVQRRYELLGERSRDIILMVRLSDGRIMEANAAAESAYGYSHVELLAMSINELRAPDTSALTAEQMSEANTRGILFETVHRRKNGSIFPAEVSSQGADISETRVLLSIIRDISERKRIEEERHHLEKQLLHAQKLESMGVLAGGIAHDFNNILTVIIGNADLALMRLAKESPVVGNLHNIEEAASRAADLAKQMLAYSGKGKFVVQSLNLNLIIKEMLQMLEVSISKKAALRLSLTPDLPTIDADATQMRQILMNLVINASEALGDENGVISLTTGSMECDRRYLENLWFEDALAEGVYAYFEITDTGCGMDPETMNRIFDPFFTTKFTGRGLGMAAVLGIVRGHKGAIKIYSEPGKGSTFKVLLPASDSPAAPVNRESGNHAWKGSGTVLLVDDEESVRSIGEELLKELGFSVITASDGIDALAAYRKHPDIDLVILDLTMPHMDGEQCFRELHNLEPGIKVIMASGYSESEVTQKFAGKGLAGFVQKPYKLSALREVLREA